MKNIYDFTVNTIDGNELSLEEYRGKVMLIVNTASKCGFTPQYSALQELYKHYGDRGLAVLGFPSNQFMKQEPGTEGEIREFCSLNFDVTFPLFRKIDVRGPGAHPLYRYLSDEARGLLGTRAVKWNFTKFLVDRSGRVITRYAPAHKPEKIREDIERLL